MQDGIQPKILFEDNRIIVVEKPPGLLSQSDFTSRLDIITILKNFIKARDSKPGNVFLGLVHRLDKEVGGAMVFAKNSKTAKQMSELIREHKFNKTYYALVEKFNLPESGTLTDWLLKDSKNNVTTVVPANKEGAKESSLMYKFIKMIGDNALVEIKLITGRSHQIRVQMASRDCPLVGDSKYGAMQKLEKFPGQIALWAYALEFEHPVSKQKMSFVSLPNFLQ